jgi:3-hydroxyisobutyrate dehydrogenase-like beta-hydroxyacid dehydrogenase
MRESESSPIRKLPDCDCGFIGLGRMGGAMAERLLQVGLGVLVFDIDASARKRLEKLGAKVAPGPRAVADRAEVVLTSLPSPAALRDVVLGPGGLIEGRSMKALVDLSTTGPGVAKELAAALASVGKKMVDASVNGNPTSARAGTLTIFTSGSEPDQANCRVLLERLSSSMIRIGSEPGSAQLAKLAINLLSASTMALTCEVLVFGVKGGLDPALLLKVLNASGARNTYTEEKLPKHVLTRTFDFGFATGLLCKDLGLGLEAAELLNVSMVVSSAAAGLWNKVLERGGPDRDFTTLVLYLEELSGVKIGPNPAPAVG